MHNKELWPFTKIYVQKQSWSKFGIAILIFVNYIKISLPLIGKNSDVGIRWAQNHSTFRGTSFGLLIHNIGGVTSWQLEVIFGLFINSLVTAFWSHTFYSLTSIVSLSLGVLLNHSYPYKGISFCLFHLLLAIYNS